MPKTTWWRDFGEGRRLMQTINCVGQELIIFDTETTGLNPATNHIIQIAAKKYQFQEDGNLLDIDTLNIYINPEYSLPKKIMELTGITDEILSEEPNEEKQWPKIFRFFGNTPVVCGHNVPFDINMLGAMYVRHDAKFVPFALDTLSMARELHSKSEVKSFKLGDLASYFGLDNDLDFHNAMSDVIACVRLLRMFIDEYRDREQEETPKKIKTRVVNCWPWTGYRGMQRLYVRVQYESRLLWFNQKQPYEWGEKDKGSIDLFDMQDIEQQVLQLYRCNNLKELSKVRESRW